jgi:GT2 family glycosyltransferase
MISVVLSTRKDNQPHIEHIKKTSGLGNKIEVIQYINDGEFGLTELYNRALKETTNNIVVFCHDDIIFDTKNWGTKLLRVMKKNPEFGIVGIAGSREVPVSGQWWENPSHMYGQVYHKHEGKRWLSKYSDKKIGFIDNTVIVDGLFFVVDKEKIKRDFDEKVEGFHFYEIDFCFRNYLEGVKIGVTSDIDVTHLSIGQTNEKWEENRKIFAEKYKDNLPSKVKKEFGKQNKLKVLIGCLVFNSEKPLLEKQLYEFSKELNKNNCQVEIITQLGDKISKEFKKNHIKCMDIKEPPGFKMGDGKWGFNTPEGTKPSEDKKLYKVKDVKYDIIHVINNELVEHISNLYPKIPNINISELDDVDKIMKEYKELI